MCVFVGDHTLYGLLRAGVLGVPMETVGVIRLVLIHRLALTSLGVTQEGDLCLAGYWGSRVIRITTGVGQIYHAIKVGQLAAGLTCIVDISEKATKVTNMEV